MVPPPKKKPPLGGRPLYQEGFGAARDGLCHPERGVPAPLGAELEGNKGGWGCREQVLPPGPPPLQLPPKQTQLFSCTHAATGSSCLRRTAGKEQN